MKHSYIYLLAICLFMMFSSGFSQTAVTKTPGSVVNGTGFSEDFPWTNPGAAAISDNSYAWFDVEGEYSGWSYNLEAKNFGFSIPAAATVTGIYVEIEKWAGTIAHDNHIGLLINGVNTGSNYAHISDNWPSEDNDEVTGYGGNSDLWSCSLDPSIVNLSNFGVSVVCYVPSLGPAYVDAITMTVYYEVECPGGGVLVGSVTGIPNSSAVFEVRSTSKGLLLPRMSSYYRNNISSPAAGLIVYDNTANKPYYYNGSSWTSINSSEVFHLTPLSSPPSSPSKGDMYFDNNTNKLKVWDGGMWQSCW